MVADMAADMEVVEFFGEKSGEGDISYLLLLIQTFLF